MATGLTSNNRTNLATAGSPDGPPGGIGHTNPAPGPHNTGIDITPTTHPSLPSGPDSISKTDANQSEAGTDPSSAPKTSTSLDDDDGLPPKKPQTDKHPNLAGIILEALQDEVQHSRGPRKSGSSGTSGSGSIADKILAAKPGTKPVGGSPNASLSTPASKTDPAAENDTTIETSPEPKPAEKKEHRAVPFQKYEPLITSEPGTHTAEPGSALGPPPPKKSTRKPKQEETESAGKKDGPAKKTAGPHHHDILNKLDPRVDSDRDGSMTLGGHGGHGLRRHQEKVEGV